MFTTNGLLEAIALAAKEGFQPGAEFVMVLRTLDGSLITGPTGFRQFTSEAVSFTHQARFTIVPTSTITCIEFDRINDAYGTDTLAAVEADLDAQAQGETTAEVPAAAVVEAADEPADDDAADDEAETETSPAEDDEPAEPDEDDVDDDDTEPDIPEYMPIGESVDVPELVPALG